MKLNGMNEAKRNECPSLAPCYVAALYVQPDGCYSGLRGVDAWDEKRDARSYDGPYPVVAHPPCQRWGKMARVNYARWGGEHNRPGNDGGTFRAALIAVRRFCGVLEHPAQTYAWEAHHLDKPTGIGWQRTSTGWVCEVWQSAYGHRANKATWLYYAGERPKGANPMELLVSNETEIKVKISDEELLSLVWVNQLRLLARSVVLNYIGGTFGLCTDDEFWYASASSTHTTDICRITDKLQRQQLRKRLIKLIDEGKLKSGYRDFITFFIDSDKARDAFSFARNYWKENGVPEGIENGKCNTAKIENIDDLAEELAQELILEFSC